MYQTQPTDWSSLAITIAVAGAIAVLVAWWGIRWADRYWERRNRQSDLRRALDKAHPEAARAREAELIAAERASNRNVALALLFLVLAVAVVVWVANINSQ
jgi:1,4-dihydroxy-2-naphthoate octaprenyltransferase